MKQSNLVLDIDGVICDFSQGVIDFVHLDKRFAKDFPTSPQELKEWNFFGADIWNEIKDNKEFWLGLKPLNNAHKKINFIPQMYLTARKYKDVTQSWLDMYGFPKAPLVMMPESQYLDKAEYLLKFPETILIVDYEPVVRLMLENGQNALLYEQPYNINSDLPPEVRVSSMEDLMELVYGD